MNISHDRRIRNISNHIKKLTKDGKSFRIFHGSTNSTRVLTFKKDEMVDVSSLRNVLSIDTEHKTATVEANVPMDKLVKTTLKRGLIPPIVMEFPGITVGGAIQGNGGESSSFKWGAFNQTFNWYEVITPDGGVLKIDENHNNDLFKALPGSAGTFAVLTAAEIRLISAKKYVQLTYTPIHSFAEAKAALESPRYMDMDFLDGIMFSKTSGVIISGSFSDTRRNLKSYRHAHDQWYYIHVENGLSDNPNGWTETARISDYLFRYERGGFWVGRFAFEIFNVKFTRFSRWLFNPLMHTRRMYKALQESGASQQHVVQDLVLPGSKFVEFADFLESHLHTYPLWLCPMLPDKTSPFQLNNIQSDSIINVGVWGASIPDYSNFININRQIENKVLQLGGKKWTYAHSYFTEEEFWSMYDQDLYVQLRKKYHSERLPTIYDKVTVKSQQPIEMRKAVFKTIFGLAKLKVHK